MSDFVLNPRKTPIKGEPDFTFLSDEKVKEYRDTIQDMIFAFRDFDKEATEVLKRVNKQLSDNFTKRLNYDTVMALSSSKSDNVVENIVNKTFKKPKIIKVVKSI